MMIAKLLSAHDVRRLCVVAECSEPTARRFLLGLPIRSTSRVRLERAAATLGVVPASPGLNASELELSAAGGMRL